MEDTRNVCFLLFNFYSICIQIENRDACISFWILEECHVMDIFFLFFNFLFNLHSD